MHFEEHNPAHFRWLMADNTNQSIYAFQRQVGNETLVFVFNMTPHFYETYDVGVSEPGEYVEIFNSDKDVYGGYNQYNGLPLEAREGYCFNQQYNITIKLASFGAMIFKHVKKEEKKEEPTSLEVEVETTNKEKSKK